MLVQASWQWRRPPERASARRLKITVRAVNVTDADIQQSIETANQNRARKWMSWSYQRSKILRHAERKEVQSVKGEGLGRWGGYYRKPTDDNAS